MATVEPMGRVDIVRDYDWTSVPRGSGLREEAPCAICTAHILENNQLQQFLGGYINTLETMEVQPGQDKGLQFYKGLYKTTGPPVGTFFFPFFTDNYRAFSNEYDNSFSSISQRGADMIGAEVIENLAGAGEKLIGGGIELGKNIAGVGAGLIDAFKDTEKDGETVKAKGVASGQATVDAKKSLAKRAGEAMGTVTMGAPGSYIETPKFYQYANTDQGLELSFALSNTLNDDAAAKNAEFIKQFTIINRPTRLGPLGMTFPAIYHIEVPGLRYIEWASLDNFGVSMLGQRRKIGGVIIPEAYVINLSFTSLTIEAANFMKMVDTPSPADAAEYESNRAEDLGQLRAQSKSKSSSVLYTTEQGQIADVQRGTLGTAQAIAERRKRRKLTMQQHRERLLGIK